jgi:uncharacterized protein YprB with RNaseH-like and TPR domain
LNPAKILLWDIETTNLKMDFGTILCIGYKWLGENKVHVPAITDYPGWQKDPTNDKKLIKDFIEVYNSADLTVTYFGIGFDRKCINAKALEWGLPLPAPIPMVDLFYTVKGNLALSRKSLQNVGYYLGLSTEKTPVEGKIWRRATTGHAGSIKYIVDHCRADVLILEEAYERLKPLVRQHPRVGEYWQCRYCAGEVIKRGFTLTTIQKPKQRVQCKNCGGWDLR